MLNIPAKEFLETWAAFENARRIAGEQRGTIATAAQRDYVVAMLCKLNGHCNYMGLTTSAALSKKLLSWLSDQANHRTSTPGGGYTMPKEPPLPDFESVYKYLQDIGEQIDREMHPIRFPVAPLQKSQFLDRDKLFGEKVFTIFEESRGDIQNAGNCIALGLNNAAVFHLMCVVKRGLRKMASDLGVTSAKPNLPIDKGTWNEVIRALQDAVNAQTTRTNVAGTAKLDLCSEMLIEFRAIEHLWRNNVMHTRANYNDTEAENACHHVERFMKKLAEL